MTRAHHLLYLALAAAPTCSAPDTAERAAAPPPPVASNARPAAPLARDSRPTQPILAWLDELALPGGFDGELVRVVDRTPGVPDDLTTLHLGFRLPSANRDICSILTTDLHAVSIAPGSSRVCEPADLTSAARELVRQIVSPEASDGRSSLFRSPRISLPAEAVVLARACEARGLHDLASILLETASAAPRQGGSFDEFIRLDVARGLAWSTVIDFGDPHITRTELLERVRRVASIMATVPDVAAGTNSRDHAAELRALTAEGVPLLERMVAEDTARGTPATTLTQTSVDERARELVFALRDQNGRQIMQPGGCDIFDDPRGNASPAHQLVALGFDAVPALIDALEDRRFTRSVGYWRDFTFSHHVLRVGDCAQQILEIIAGRTFFPRRYTNAQMAKDNQAAEVKRAAIDWWEKARVRGEARTLVDNVSTGGWLTGNTALRLARLDPEAALPAIEVSLERAERAAYKRPLLDALAAIPGEAPLPLLRKTMHRDAELGARVAAARGLIAHGRRAEAEQALVHEWRDMAGRPPGDPFATEELLVQVASCEGCECVEALGSGLVSQALGVRAAVTGALRMPDELGCGGSPGPFPPHWWSPAIELEWTRRPLGFPTSFLREPRIESSEARTMIRHLLMGQLGDREVHEAMRCRIGELQLAVLRPCDLAAHALSQRWPDEYRFDLTAPLDERDRQIEAIRGSSPEP